MLPTPPATPPKQSFWSRIKLWHKIAAGAVIALLLLSGIDMLTNPEGVPYSGDGSLLERVTAGEIIEVQQLDTKIVGTTADGDEITSYVPSRLVTDIVADIDRACAAEGAECAEELSIRSAADASSSLLLTVVGMLPFILLVGLLFYFMNSGGGIFGMGKDKSKSLDPERTTVTFEDVAGVEEAKSELAEVVDFLKNPDKYLAIGARIPRGVLMAGPPGTGKTLLAKAIATEAGVPFFHTSASEFIEMIVGVGAARMRSLFEKAREAAPSIIFIDEIDAIGRSRGAGSSLGGGHDEREQTLNQLLVEMDGFDDRSETIVIGSSVTGDTLVLVKDPKGVVGLHPIADVIDPYYRSEDDEGEKPSSDLRVLGFERKENPRRVAKFSHSAFVAVRSVFRHRVSEIFEVKYRGGTIRATGNHSVFVRVLHGVEPRAVIDLRPGDVLVDLPYKVNRTSPDREIRAHRFRDEWALTLPVYSDDSTVLANHQFALRQQGNMSQSVIAGLIGVSQTAVSKWQRGVSAPRSISRAYFQHELPEEIEVTPELCRLMGYYTAEGYSRKELDFCFGTHEADLIADVQRITKDVFGIDADEVRVVGSATHVIYRCRPLARFFAAQCGKGSHNKHIPSFLFEAPYEYFLEYFRGYWNGDGHTRPEGRGVASSLSRQLISELNWLCRMHGIKTTTNRIVVAAGRRINGGKPLSETIRYTLNINQNDNPLDPASVARTSGSRAPKILSITRQPFDGYVYDFCGCENEAFFGGESPVLLHNTNRPDVLDPALLRPGRFDRTVLLDAPDRAGREAILRVHARGKLLHPEVALENLARETPGMSGADLANVMNEAAINTVRRGGDQIKMIDLRNAVERVIAGPERTSHLMSPEEKWTVAVHETGHALVQHLLPGCDPVVKITIVSRGMALGYTMAIPEREARLKSRSSFRDQIAGLLGGNAAELLFFSEMTTGAANDMSKATEIARKMVTEWGMDDRIGPITVEAPRIGDDRKLTPLSETTARAVDDAIRGLVEEGRTRASKLLSRHRASVERIARQLMEVETLDGPTFAALAEDALAAEHDASEYERNAGKTSTASALPETAAR